MTAKIKQVEGMTWYILDQNEARHIWLFATHVELYRLYDDGSESLILGDEEFGDALIDGSTIGMDVEFKNELI